MAEVLQGGHYILGPQVQSFEQSLSARYSHERQAIAVNSGTDALVLALHLLDLQAGDEVILPAGTFIACFEAVIRSGATPVLADSRADDFLCSAEQIRPLITPRTRAVMAVPLFGDTSATPAIAQLCKDQGIALIEDIAQALGAQTRDANGDRLHAGSMGDIATLSFYPTKTLGAAGDAGALISPHTHLVERARALRNHGRSGALHGEVGFNSRMDELQAVVLRHGIARLDTWLHERRSIAQRYLEQLADLPDIFLPHRREGHAWNYFVLRSPRRDELKAELNRLGVDTRVYYDPPIHQQPSYLQRFAAVELPNLQRHAQQALALPLYAGMPASEVDLVIDAMRAAVNSMRR
ncbi:DegT/DnrJ/EryC1/StrS family aminotransferase [Diaphorobacter sp. HDW4B]|nr:DegT/DnrJ/EryC1/StrS family aminotransferase [Diaphorobacter sp. HDW4B]